MGESYIPPHLAVFFKNLIAGLCERALVSSVNVRTCVAFYCAAEECGATTLLNHCSSLISINWSDLLPQDFVHMTSALLHKMLKSKTKHPLHSAIRLRREDVVFLCLVESEGTVSRFYKYLFSSAIQMIVKSGQ